MASLDLSKREEIEIQKAKVFEALLSNIIRQTAKPRGSIYTVLNIGCRAGSDTGVIRTACQKQGLICKQLGVDVDWDAIEWAKKKYADGHTQFYCANAAQADVVALYPADTDLILLRHPEVFVGNPMQDGPQQVEPWLYMIALALQNAAVGTKVLCTLFNEKEFELMTKFWPNILESVDLVCAGKNPCFDESFLQYNYRTETQNGYDQYLLQWQKNDKPQSMHSFRRQVMTTLGFSF